MDNVYNWKYLFVNGVENIVTKKNILIKTSSFYHIVLTKSKLLGRS